MNKKIKIAQIGINTNSHSNDIFKTLEKQSEIFEIAGYVLPENECERLPQRAVRDNAYWHEDHEKQTRAPFDRYENMMRSFAEMVRGEKENPYTLDYELELYKILLCACGRGDTDG